MSLPTTPKTSTSTTTTSHSHRHLPSDVDDAWAQPSPGPGSAVGAAGTGPDVEKSEKEVLAEAVRKEGTIRDIVNLQKRLKETLTQITTLETSNEKTTKENDTLGVYIDNLAKNVAISVNQRR